MWVEDHQVRQVVNLARLGVVFLLRDFLSDSAADELLDVGVVEGLCIARLESLVERLRCARWLRRG